MVGACVFTMFQNCRGVARGRRGFRAGWRGRCLLQGSQPEDADAAALAPTRLRRIRPRVTRSSISAVAWFSGFDGGNAGECSRERHLAVGASGRHAQVPRRPSRAGAQRARRGRRLGRLVRLRRPPPQVLRASARRRAQKDLRNSLIFLRICASGALREAGARYSVFEANQGIIGRWMPPPNWFSLKSTVGSFKPTSSDRRRTNPSTASAPTSVQQNS